jgi:hypothetical protein
MEIGGASIRLRWYAAAGVLLWLGAGLGGCGSSSKSGGTGGAGGHGGATGGAGGHGGGGGAIDSGAPDGGPDARGTDGGTGDASDGRVDASPVAMVSFTFDSDINGFGIDVFPTTNPVNLGALSADGGSLVTATFDGVVGMPSPGSARVEATFSDYNQVVAFRYAYQGNPAFINLTGATLTARVRLDATGPDGGATTFTGGVARIYALSTPTTPGFFLAEGGTVQLSDNNWHTMTFRLNGAEFIDPRFDPTNVVQIGVHIATPPPVTGDAAVPPYGAPQPISVHIDTLSTN